MHMFATYTVYPIILVWIIPVSLFVLMPVPLSVSILVSQPIFVSVYHMQFEISIAIMPDKIFNHVNSFVNSIYKT